MHRDLKMENILITKKLCNNLIKIIDFGFAKEYKEGEMGETFCGTPIMMPP